MATPIVGIDAQHWAKLETTYDTVSAFASGDAVPLLEISIEPSKEFHKSMEHTGSASLETEIAGIKGGTWSCSAYAKPAAAGTAPDINPFLTAGLGTETISGGTSATYSLSNSAQSLQIGRYAGAGLYEVINGCWVESVEIEITGNDEPKFTFSGGFASYGFVYDGATIASGSGTTITVNTAHVGKIQKNALIKIGSEDNGGSGYTVTAVDNTAETLTITPTLAGSVSASDVIEPVVPGFTLTASTILGGVNAGLTLGGTSVGMISTKYTISTGIHGLNKEATAETSTRLARGAREVTGELNFYYLSENAAQLGQAWDGTTRAVNLRIGEDTAAKRCKVNAPAARLEVSGLEIPEAEEATFTAAFVCRKSAVSNDELTIVFD